MSEPLTNPRVSVLIPVFNEGAGTAGVCSGVRRVLEPMGSGAFEIIVIDDGSTDGALKETPAGADLIVRHRRNRGYGASLKTGLTRCRGEMVVIIDADGTYDPAYIPKLIETVSLDTPMAVGSRTGASIKIPALRKPAKWVLTALANYLAGQRIPDLNSGLRAALKDDVIGYRHLLPNGFSLTTTLTLAFLCDGKEVAYLPINYGSRRSGQSKIRPIRDTLQILNTIVRTVMSFNPLKVFLPLAAIFGVLSLAVLYVSARYMPRVMDGTVAVLALAAGQSIAVGVLADMLVRLSKARR
jgi:glycosyltransferase involved in cell wall biosynthesis